MVGKHKKDMEIHVRHSINLDHSLEETTMIVEYCHETSNEYKNADSRDDNVRTEASDNINTTDPNEHNTEEPPKKKIKTATTNQEAPEIPNPPVSKIENEEKAKTTATSAVV